MARKTVREMGVPILGFENSKNETVIQLWQWEDDRSNGATRFTISVHIAGKPAFAFHIQREDEATRLFSGLKAQYS